MCADFRCVKQWQDLRHAPPLGQATAQFCENHNMFTPGTCPKHGARVVARRDGKDSHKGSCWAYDGSKQCGNVFALQTPIVPDGAKKYFLDVRFNLTLWLAAGGNLKGFRGHYPSVSPQAVSDMFKFLTQCCFLECKEPIKSSTLCIDETKLFPVKYSKGHKGKPTRCRWFVNVCGLGVVGGSNRVLWTRWQMVAKRDAPTLMSIIDRHAEKIGSEQTVISDCWKGYINVGTKYNLIQVNHSNAWLTADGKYSTNPAEGVNASTKQSLRNVSGKAGDDHSLECKVAFVTITTGFGGEFGLKTATYLTAMKKHGVSVRNGYKSDTPHADDMESYDSADDAALGVIVQLGLFMREVRQPPRVVEVLVGVVIVILVLVILLLFIRRFLLLAHHLDAGRCVRRGG